MKLMNVIPREQRSPGDSLLDMKAYSANQPKTHCFIRQYALKDEYCHYCGQERTRTAKNCFRFKVDMYIDRSG